MMLFDGRGLADEIEKQVVTGLSKFKTPPKLVTLFNEQDRASSAYTTIKQKKAAELGVNFVAYLASSTSDPAGLIRQLNFDVKVNGIMVQLPFGMNRSADSSLCLLIDPKKDVDGLNLRSNVMPATVRAVLEVLKKINKSGRIVVVGNLGTVGSYLCRVLNCEGMDKFNFNADLLGDADIIISATGQPGLIRGDMVKEGVVAIDVGYPKGDFDQEAAKKASVITPVPGGIGPVTVACLFANLVDLYEHQISRIN